MGDDRKTRIRRTEVHGLNLRVSGGHFSAKQNKIKIEKKESEIEELEKRRKKAMERGKEVVLLSSG